MAFEGFTLDGRSLPEKVEELLEIARDFAEAAEGLTGDDARLFEAEVWHVMKESGLDARSLELLVACAQHPERVRAAFARST